MHYIPFDDDQSLQPGFSEAEFLVVVWPEVLMDGTMRCFFGRSTLKKMTELLRAL